MKNGSLYPHPGPRKQVEIAFTKLEYCGFKLSALSV
jgi:hypothetical protein